MLLPEYLNQPGAASALARALDVPDAMVSQWKAGKKQPGPEMAMQIEIATDGAVRRWDLRPDDWHRIWWELINTPGAPAVPAVPTAEQAA